MEFTTIFELQSQTTRLIKNNYLVVNRSQDTNGSVTLSAALFQGT